MAWDYTATGDETFMYIGNFQPDSQTDTLYVLQEDPEENYSMFSYYYIDKIELKEGTLNTTDKLYEESFKLYPNPVSDKLTIESEHKLNSLLVFDLEGRCVKRTYSNNDNVYKVDTTDLLNGMYVIRIKFKDGVEINRKFVKW